MVEQEWRSVVVVLIEFLHQLRVILTRSVSLIAVYLPCIAAGNH